MWLSRRRVVVLASLAAPLRVSQRRAHSAHASSTPPAATAASAPRSDAAKPSSELQLDDTDGWILDQMQRAVDKGHQTQKAADYFREIMHDQPEFHQCMQEARRLMGGQDPDKLTRYQQGQFADRLCNYMSGIASDKLRRAHAEEQSTKRYTQDGTPTGENYWFEAGNTLSSPAVPGFVKDEVLKEMQQERSAKSPAYEQPPEEAQMAAEDEGYASHLRRQRNKLLSDTDFS